MSGKDGRRRISLPFDERLLYGVEADLEQFHAVVVHAPQLGHEIADIEDPFIRIGPAIGGRIDRAAGAEVRSVLGVQF